MASKELDLYNSTKSRALARAQSAQETLDEINTKREAVQRETKEMANTPVNIIFALDATASRENSWEESRIIQNFMFGAVSASGLKPAAQLVSYSGLTQGGDIAAGKWNDTAFSLHNEMKDISCVTGYTQIAKVFKHAIRENTRRKVHAVILVADSCEEDGEELKRLGAELRKKSIHLYILNDADRSTDSHNDTPRIFRATAEAAEGVYLPFDQENIPVLIEYLKVATVTASGNETAVARTEKTIVTPEGRAFLDRRKRQMLLTNDRR